MHVWFWDEKVSTNMTEAVLAEFFRVITEINFVDGIHIYYEPKTVSAQLLTSS